MSNPVCWKVTNTTLFEFISHIVNKIHERSIPTVDYRRCALIINYDVEATVLDDDDEIIRKDRKSRKQLMRVPHLDEHTDILTLAEEIVSG